jgi:zinc D-Ala-D-Ala dipeptidase
MGYKVYVNYVLWLLGIRDVLPSSIINSKRIKECGEPLVAFQNTQIRSGVLERLNLAQGNLPNGIFIKIMSGYRSLDEQKKLWEQSPDKTKIANPETGGGGHQTGAAVDLILVDINGTELDMGGKYLIFDENTPTKSVKNKNRKMLVRAMKSAGFTNYPLEWWHFSYGDKMWAAYAKQKNACYGVI